MEMAMEKHKVIRTALRIRAFEQFLLFAFDSGLLKGTTHTCIGQELTPSLLGALIPKDVFIVSNHRNHGHFIGAGGSPSDLLLEIAGDPKGVSSGIGGSQHIHSANFISHGILGGLVPYAVGKGFARRLSNGNKKSVIIFIGDGTFGEGIIYEALNLSTVFDSDVLFIVENNSISQSTPTNSVLFGDIFERCKSIVPDTSRVSDKNWQQLVSELNSKLFRQAMVSHSRVVVVDTERLGPHSKGKSPVNPWLSETDPVYLASGATTDSKFHEIAFEPYKEISEIFNSVFGTDMFTLKKFMGDVNHEII